MLISITIPVYNNLKGLTLSLQSIIDQTYTQWEVIVVDDGSTENHKSVIEKFNDDRIRFHRFDKNKGRPVARQKTFELMQGEYCAFLDAGDCYEKDFLEKAVHFFSKDKSLLGVSQSMKIVYKNKTYYTYYDKEGAIDIKSPMYQKIGFAPTIIKADICKNYVFDPALKYSQDRHFLNYLSENNDGKIILINSLGYVYNQGNDNIKVSTTFKKYRYDSLRLYKEGKYIKAAMRLCQAFLGALYHRIFGYNKVLEKRYGHNSKKVKK